MGENSKIEWTDATWTPIRARRRPTKSDPAGEIGWHCERVSEGCANCYAEGINKRLGTGLPFKPGHRDNIELFLDETMLLAPLRWKKPRMIFVCSMTDLFGDWVKDEWIDKIFAIMALCPQHTFQVLTKRPARMREHVDSLYKTSAHVRTALQLVTDGIITPGLMIEIKIPIPNVWLMTSAERQDEADERIPHLLATPAAVRGVSLEPLLGPIDLLAKPRHEDALGFVNWVIVGGESGPKARVFDLIWARPILRQCKAAGVPCFLKQLGAHAVDSARLDDMPQQPDDAGPEDIAAFAANFVRLRLKHAKGGDPDEWPDDLRIREMPQVRR